LILYTQPYQFLTHLQTSALCILSVSILLSLKVVRSEVY
jgi:hypothetical protein